MNNFTCNCVPGYTGAMCEVDIDECEEIVCQNNGTCINLVNQYKVKIVLRKIGLVLLLFLSVSVSLDTLGVNVRST